MIALKILDVKSYMSSLLIQPVFDDFFVSEIEVHTFNTFRISGRLHKGWYLEDELEGQEYSCWKDIKSTIYHIVKGKRTPSFLKIVCLLSEKDVKELLERVGSTFSVEDVDGLFMNMRFEKGELSLVTGTSLKVFTLDKTLEQEWDRYVKRFLTEKEIAFEEI